MILLEDILLESGRINSDQIAKIKANGKPLAKMVVESDLMSEDELLKIISERLNIPFNILSDIKDISIPEIEDTISINYMREHSFIPVSLNGETLTIATSNPLNLTLTDELREFTGHTLALQLAKESEIKVAIERFFGAGSGNMAGIIDDIKLEDSDIKEDSNVDHLKDLASEAPVIKLVNLIINNAVEKGASDIHIEPFEDDLIIRYRIDGVLHKVESPPKRLQAALISRLKIMAKLNIAERRLPQDGRISFSVVGKGIDIRVSTLPTIYGESVVLRILDISGGHHDLANVGLSEMELKRFEGLISKPYGMILVTGPTGSGKTTTLYGAMEEINKPDIKIITIEDPVEYQVKGINQIHVKPNIGLTFASGLRSIVRQDPDVIMIGEIRDPETAGIAIQSALTGHMVFSTVHTNDSAGAITRLADMDVENFLISSALVGVLAQRLVRVICNNCKTKNGIDAETIKKLGIKNIEGSADVYVGEGCDKCNHTGYGGRIGIFELLIINDAIRKLILKNSHSNRIKEEACRMGMRTLREDGWEKVKMGITSVAEVMRVTVEEEL